MLIIFLKFLFGVILTIISAILYRAGGMGKEETAQPEWIPVWLRESWVRDWLIPLFTYIYLLMFWWPATWWHWILLILCYPLLGGALSTYWDVLFGFDNYWFAGFMCGIAAFPLLFCGIHWYTILIRAIMLAVSWGALCAISKKDTTEEFGRGGFLTATIPLLLF